MTDPHETWRALAEQLPLLSTLEAPVVWAELDEPQTAQALEDLADWVDWVTDRYHLDARVVPPCWPEHGELVEELSALRGAWHATYGPAGTGADALQWHADFALARQRLGDWVARTGCRQGHHRPPH